MGSKWRKVKLALGLNSCVHIPQPLDDDSSAARFSGATSSAASSLAGDNSGYSQSIRSPSSSGFRLLKSPKVYTFHYPFTCLDIKFHFLLLGCF